MLMFNKSNYDRKIGLRDFVALMLVFGVLLAFQFRIDELSAPIALIDHNSISLDPSNLPDYAMFTVIRMLIAVTFSLIFAIGVATLAAKSKRLERIIIPVVDILQSVPILGFLSFTITFFLSLFPGDRLGVELAAIFVIFTSQVWNMVLSFYQSLKNVPKDLVEAADIMHLSAFDKFFRLELPFALPSLIWNMMLSMSGGWFFIVASEAITVGNINYTLPGIGSYISLAIKMMDMHAVILAISAMIIVIFIYDFLLFRPLVTWAEKFKYENIVNSNPAHSYIFTLFHNNYFFKKLAYPFYALFDFCLDICYKNNKKRKNNTENKPMSKVIDIIWYMVAVVICIYGAIQIFNYIKNSISLMELLHALKLTFYTALRVFVLIALSLMIWVPIGIYIGLRPGLTAYSQSVIQFLAAFPVNLLFPLVVVCIKYFGLDPNIWLTLLMMIGTQWYIAFNVIAGTSMFAGDLKEVCNNFSIKGYLWWFKVMIPSISPYILTGIMAASGAAWNASIVSEVVNWGNDTFIAQGVGSYIAVATGNGNLQKIALGIMLLSLVVMLINRLIWRPLYRRAEQLTQIN